MARPTKYKPEVVEAITKAIKAGATLTVACLYAGIDMGTLARWRARYSDFADAIQKAEADCIVRRVARIEKAGADGTWQADAWLLERRFPKDYGNRIKHDFNLAEEAAKFAAQHKDEGLDPKQIVAEVEAMLAE